MAAWLHGTQHGLYVGLPLFGACQEMKDGAVMPDVVGVKGRSASVMLASIH
jgi:hypothetical protein